MVFQSLKPITDKLVITTGNNQQIQIDYGIETRLKDLNCLHPELAATLYGYQK